MVIASVTSTPQSGSSIRGAQLWFTDAGGLRVAVFIAYTEPGALSGQVAGLELRHRQHAPVEDRTGKARSTRRHGGQTATPPHEKHYPAT